MVSPFYRRLLFHFLPFCIASFFSLSASAQWRADSTHNTVVCKAAGIQDQPQGCSDGANGAIIVWEDARGGTYQVYAQHLDSNGIATWAPNGIKLATNANGATNQRSPIAVTDDSGGAYVVWTSDRYASQFGTVLFAQHIRANGVLAYTDTAYPVAIGLNNVANPTLCDDGRGGAYVAWEDYRTSVVSSRPDIYMNRLWPGGAKFGVTTSGSQGIVTKLNFGHGNYYTFFHDSAAHFKPYMVGLSIKVYQNGAWKPYTISAVTSDTSMEFATYPNPAANLPYYVAGPIGISVDTFTSKQTKPSICSDGYGGCFLAWTSSGISPNSIYGTHIDSTGRQLWDAEPQPGFLLFQGQTSTANARNVTLNRDGNQVLFTWEVYNANNGSYEIYAERLRNNTPMDTAFAWGSPVDVTSDWPNDQLAPEIFGDDSLVLGTRGALVPFINQEPGGGDNYDACMVRVFGDGGRLLPPGGQGFTYMEMKPHGHTGLASVKVTDPSDPTRTGLISVWNDFWSGTDTMVYAQRVDRTGRHYFGSPWSWGQAISGHGPNGQHWTAKQVAIVPRTDGAIATWTDNRNGNFDIYAQFIPMTGIATIPTDTIPAVSKIASRTGSFNGTDCNAKCTNVVAIDTGAHALGIDSIGTVNATNMRVTIPAFPFRADSVAFSVCVTDSMQDGNATVQIVDEALNTSTATFTYCTILDTLAPAVTWDTVTNWLDLHFRETRPWDRGLQSITVLDSSNVSFVPPISEVHAGSSGFDMRVMLNTQGQAAHFSLQAQDASGNKTAVFAFEKQPTNGVIDQNPTLSLSIFPNPISKTATIQLNGASSAEVKVLDVLGRPVDQFHVDGSFEWQPRDLTAGTYVILANIGTNTILKRIVIQ